MARKVVVIDDCSTFLDGVKKAFENEGYEIMTATSPREGIALVESAPPDCLLMDFLMPEIDGAEVCRKIKASKNGDFIPVIMLASKDKEKEIVSGLQAGADDYVHKTSDMKVLLARVEAAIRIKVLYDELKKNRAELQVANKQLQKLDGLKSDSVSMVIHELRTPLVAIKDSLSLLVEGLAGPVNEKQLKFIRISLKNTEGLEALINDLLDISKIEAGKMQIIRKKRDIGETINDSISSLRNLAGRKRITILDAVPEGLPPVYGDEGRLGQVLVNLIGNAIKFTPDGGNIEVTARLTSPDSQSRGPGTRGEVAGGEKSAIRNPQSAMHIEVSVSDTGIGIAPGDIDKVFEKFEQSGYATNPGDKGTGLGLPICKKIIELHEGRIWVTSEPDQGSTFYFTVPIYSEKLHFQWYFQEALRKAGEGGFPLALVLVNIENLTRVRDLFGERTSEQVTARVTKAIQSRIRQKEDSVLPYDSGGLIAVLAEADQSGIRAITANLRDSLCSSKFDVPMVFRIGGAVYPDDGKNCQELFKVAESRFQRFQHPG